MPKLSDWKWCVDFSKTIGQDEAKINPELFLTRADARQENNNSYPHGRVIKVTIREIKRK